jgi:hypothetical protein
VLSGRLNLPAGYGPSAYEKRKDQPQRSLDSAGAGTVAPSRGKGALPEISEEAEGSGSSSSEGSSDEDGEGNEGGPRCLKYRPLCECFVNSIVRRCCSRLLQSANPA